MRHPYLFKTRAGITPFVAADRLLRFGVLPVNPCVYTFSRKLKDGTPEMKVEPQLPGYFVGFFDADKLWQVSQAGVLTRCISPDNMVRPLRESVYDTIREMNRLSIEAPEIDIGQGKRLRAGMTVLLRHGPFANQRVVLQSAYSNGNRAKALLDYFGTLKEVVVEAGKVDVEEAA